MAGQIFVPFSFPRNMTKCAEFAGQEYFRDSSKSIRMQQVKFGSEHCPFERSLCHWRRLLPQNTWFSVIFGSSFGRDYRIPRLPLCRDIRLLPPSSVLNVILNYPMARLQARSLSTPPSLSLPGSLWPGVVAPDMIPSV